MLKCRICGDEAEHKEYIGYEMMYGTRESFKYMQCKACGCLQIQSIPKDLKKYYPVDYYSHSKNPSLRYNLFKRLIIKQRVRNALFGKGYKLNKLASKFVDMPLIKVKGALPVLTILKQAGIKNFQTRFLDVGCGNWSDWLADLKDLGFNSLKGAEPFIDSDVLFKGIHIKRQTVSDVQGEYDLITFHHSFEHIPDQLETLLSAKKVLASKGSILLRIPTVSSTVWERYNTNWVEMDPPRHLYLHSDKSISLLAKKAGLKVYAKLCDSTEFEFYASEQYVKGIPLISDKSFELHRNNGLFSKNELSDFKLQADAANRESRGGRACYFLRTLS